MRQLSGMANNLNQLARQANKEGHSKYKDANATLAMEIYNILKLFRDDGKDHKR